MESERHGIAIEEEKGRHDICGVETGPLRGEVDLAEKAALSLSSHSHSPSTYTSKPDGTQK